MTRKRKPWRPVAAVGLLALALGGVVGWWLAMRSMPVDETAPDRVAGEPDGGDMKGMPGMAGEGMEPVPEGRARVVQVDPVRLQRIGVRYGVARREPLERELRAEAVVAYDEEHRAYVTTKIGGWVERLYVDKPGQPVRRGQPLLEIYSPELVSTARELVLALEHAERESAGAGERGPEGTRGAMVGAGALSRGSLVEAARRRLELWDVPRPEIERLERTREVRRTLSLAAPVGGVVVEKYVLEGARVEAGENLYLIADLSTVWVEGRVFETDLAEITVGQPATVSVEAYPGETFPGKVGFVYPYLEPATRTVTVRLEMPNPAGRLKPGMFATAVFETGAGRESVVVPASAVVETGERAFVLVKRGEGLFEPREVRVGERGAERVAIAEGVAAGDTVVTSANFLIDSEANLMAFMGGMLGMGMPRDQMRMDMQEMEGRKDMRNMQGAQGGESREEMEGMEGMDGMKGKEDGTRR